MIHDYEAPCGLERIPFGSVMALFAMGTMTFSKAPFCHGRLFAMAPMAFVQAETLKMGIVTAQGEPQKNAKCTSPCNHQLSKRWVTKHCLREDNDEILHSCQVWKSLCLGVDHGGECV